MDLAQWYANNFGGPVPGTQGVPMYQPDPNAVSYDGPMPYTGHPPVTRGGGVEYGGPPPYTGHPPVTREPQGVRYGNPGYVPTVRDPMYDRPGTYPLLPPGRQPGVPSPRAPMPRVQPTMGGVASRAPAGQAGGGGGPAQRPPMSLQPAMDAARGALDMSGPSAPIGMPGMVMPASGVNPMAPRDLQQYDSIWGGLRDLLGGLGGFGGGPWGRAGGAVGGAMDGFGGGGGFGPFGGGGYGGPPPQFNPQDLAERLRELAMRQPWKSPYGWE